MGVKWGFTSSVWLEGKWFLGEACEEGRGSGGVGVKRGRIVGSTESGRGIGAYKGKFSVGGGKRWEKRSV